MTAIFRLALFAAGLVAIHLTPSPSRHYHLRALSPADRRIAYAATTRAGRGPRAVIPWLQHLRAVGTMRLTHGSIDVHFRDGAELFILPRSHRHPVRSAALSPDMTRLRQTAGAPRALVLEPFADELGLGADAGQDEADILSRAGFAVEILRNSAVTVQAMETLSSYAVVYVETHSDPLTVGGDAVIATGEVNSAGANASLFADGSLRQVTVAGDTSHIYDAITGAFVSQHLSNFPNSSIVFINGCGVRDAPLFWNALQSRNVAALIGWDSDVPSVLNVEAGHFILSRLANSSTVAGSVASAVTEGLGIGVTATGTARLGFTGDGLDTLAAARTGVSPPSMPPAMVVVSSSSPTATPAAAATPHALATIASTARARPAARRRGPEYSYTGAGGLAKAQ